MLDHLLAILHDNWMIARANYCNQSDLSPYNLTTLYATLLHGYTPFSRTRSHAASK